MERPKGIVQMRGRASFTYNKNSLFGCQYQAVVDHNAGNYASFVRPFTGPAALPFELLLTKLGFYFAHRHHI